MLISCFVFNSPYYCWFTLLKRINMLLLNPNCREKLLAFTPKDQVKVIYQNIVLSFFFITNKLLYSHQRPFVPVTILQHEKKDSCRKWKYKRYKWVFSLYLTENIFFLHLLIRKTTNDHEPYDLNLTFLIFWSLTSRLRENINIWPLLRNILNLEIINVMRWSILNVSWQSV